MARLAGARGATIAMVLLLAAAAAGCQDPAADARAAAEAKARAEAAEKAQRLQTAVDFASQCVGALRWQSALLASTGIGKVSIYTDYYRAQLEKALGDQTIAAAPPKPALSRATIDAYLDWASAEGVKTKFGGRGPEVISACVQAVAEAGKGPLAGPDKVGRMFHMQALRTRLKTNGA